MFNNYTSEQLLREFSRPLINFLWYLWETYGNPNEPEFRVTLQGAGDDKGQQFVIHATGNTVTQDFDCNINTEIVIRKAEHRYFMEKY